ncbi:hypothetical protein TIFTF001_052028 [Ficus carica]|uniref:Uncharacterized protein n=1 Tax=Ficus carica TaxID=3494 RepID=A0AA88EDD8_FICCA|nr:hypothetical protein TIFTF001_052022 [Ficus carica]GMN72536.1 hypothetical protein TIFTF001_052028 [Ficus carica]
MGNEFLPALDNRRPHLVRFVRPTVDGSSFFVRRRWLAMSAMVEKVAIPAVAGFRRDRDRER